MGLFALFNGIVFIPLVQELLRIFPLPEITDYLVIGGVTLMWGVVLLGIWRSRWFRAGVDWFARRFFTPIVDGGARQPLDYLVRRHNNEKS
jgi:hypothetical protein